MLNIKQIIAMALVATFLAAIPLAVLSFGSEVTTVVFTIEIEENHAKPSSPGKPSRTSKDYKILLNRYVSDIPVDLTIYTNNFPVGISVGAFFSAFDSAAEVWDAASERNLYGATTVIVDGSGAVAADDVNAVFFADLGSRIIAQATVMYIRFTKEIVECDIQFNTYFTWGDATLPETPSVMDLQNIATHELGHFFNLADIYDDSKDYLTMYGYSDYGETNKRDLDAGDIAGIVAVFGS